MKVQTTNMITRHLKLPIFDADDPPLPVAARPLRTLARERVMRIALIGTDQVMKHHIADVLRCEGWTVVNHLDPLKDDLVHWLTIYRFLSNKSRAYVWEEFCEWVVVDLQTARKDLAYLLDPLFEDIIALSTWAMDHAATIERLEDYERLHEERLAFVDQHADIFAPALARYALVAKELTADDLYLVDETVTRSLKCGSCVNTDTQTERELDILRHCGWFSIYLYSDRDRTDPSEDLPRASACDLVVDGRFPLGRVMLDLTDGLLRRVG